MSEQKIEIGKPLRRFNVLANQLLMANLHLFYFMRLDEARADYYSAFVKSHYFWEYTKRAHLQATILQLGKAFDKDRGSIQMHRFLSEIPESGLTKNEKILLQSDKLFCQEKSPDPLVAKLRHWRDNVAAHYNYRMTTPEGRATLADEKFPPYTELQQLIDKGFEILERWAALHKAMPGFKKLPDDKDDYLFVLDAIQTKEQNG
jgi:hypothetical protein